jgi:hypothetical protein
MTARVDGGPLVAVEYFDVPEDSRSADPLTLANAAFYCPIDKVVPEILNASSDPTTVSDLYGSGLRQPAHVVIHPECGRSKALSPQERVERYVTGRAAASMRVIVRRSTSMDKAEIPSVNFRCGGRGYITS